MQSGRLGIPVEVRHRYRRGWILLLLIVLGGMLAAGLWYAVGVHGPKHGTPPPPAHKDRAIRQKLVPIKQAKPAPEVQVQKVPAVVVQGKEAQSLRIQQMIEQVEKMQQEVKQQEGAR